jgi:2-keto-3-deoxy-L-rhamnonate aldolase RhmA
MDTASSKETQMADQPSFPPNKVRQKLKAGKLVSGSVIYTMHPGAMYSAGYSGLDFIRIDNEHQWNRDEAMATLIQTGNAVGVETIVRIDRDDPYMARKVLELGAGGIIFPQLRSAEEVKEHVRYTKFPPNGIRGYSSCNWAGGWGTKSGNAYVEWSDREPMIGTMIENVDAVGNIEAMLSVEGIDFALFGPADLSMSMGLRRPNQDHPKVQEALAETIRIAKKLGKFVMFDTSADPEQIRYWAEKGITMFELDHELSIFRSIWKTGAELIDGLK